MRPRARSRHAQLFASRGAQHTRFAVLGVAGEHRACFHRAMSRETDRIINEHILWSMGAGLVPVPLLDIAAVSAIQLDMLKQLCSHYGVAYTESEGKVFLSALTG